MKSLRAFRAWIHERRLERAELRLADTEHYLNKWGFANTPSQDRAAEKRIERLRRKVEALRAAG